MNYCTKKFGPEPKMLLIFLVKNKVKSSSEHTEKFHYFLQSHENLEKKSAYPRESYAFSVNKTEQKQKNYV